MKLIITVFTLVLATGLAKPADDKTATKKPIISLKFTGPNTFPLSAHQMLVGVTMTNESDQTIRLEMFSDGSLNTDLISSSTPVMITHEKFFLDGKPASEKHQLDPMDDKPFIYGGSKGICEFKSKESKNFSIELKSLFKFTQPGTYVFQVWHRDVVSREIVTPSTQSLVFNRPWSKEDQAEALAAPIVRSDKLTVTITPTEPK